MTLTTYCKKSLVLLSSVLMLVLSGCSIVPPIVSTLIPPPQIKCQNPPKVDKANPLLVIFQEVKDEYQRVWLGLTGKEYEKLSANAAMMQKGLDQKNAQLSYYQACIEQYNERAKP